MVVVILVDGKWIPAHPGKLMSQGEVEQLVSILQADGYKTALVLAENWNTPLTPYRLEVD